MSYAIVSHNPAGIDFNDGYYALAAAIHYNLSVNKAIQRVMGINLNIRTPKTRPPKGTYKKKIIELHKKNPELSIQIISRETGCSIEMVKHTLKHLTAKKEKETKTADEEHKKSISKPKKTKETKIEVNITIETMQKNPNMTTQEIADETGISILATRRRIRKYYRSLQMELPFN